jgi:two-component system CheB/CheR fusion protein
MDIENPPSGIHFPVVGIGASAGGYAALITLLENMPADSGMALVVILHLSADEPSSADKLLQRATAMPVLQVVHTTPILPDKVYVIPPGRSLAMRSGELILDRLDRGDRPVAIDLFLRTLAEAHRENAIGIVLSGMGSDGTAGLACIREMGGMTIVQLPTDAEQGSMPRAAIESGAADFVLPVGEMPRKLCELRDTLAAIRRKASVGRLLDGVPIALGPRPEAALRKVLAVLHERTGHDFTHYRRPTLLRRLERRLQVRGAPDLDAYFRLLQDDAAEAQALQRDLLIGVTGFYRDPEAFEALDRVVLPELFRSGREPLRAWIAACSTGEEAYTLAMMLADRAARDGDQREWQMFASDIDEQAIVAARAGRYPVSITGSIPDAQLQRWFIRDGEQYKVRKNLRDRILFAPHNLLHEPAFSRLDLISCRNFLIYLNPDMHRHLLLQFHFALNPGGYLMLGSAESVEAATDLFVPVDAAQKIYQARRIERPPASPAVAARMVRTLAPSAAGALERSAADAAAPSPMRHGKLFSFADIHLHKAAELAPPSILLNADGEIVHLSEQAGDFLRQGGGEPTRELVSLVAPPLQLALRAALFQAGRSGRPAATGPIRYEQQEGVRTIDLQVLPFQDPHAEGGLMLVRFVDVAEAPVQAISALPLDPVLLGELDEELRRTRRQLRETIEQTESGGNEMRLYSEEMQTTVEELRVSAAELERSRAQLLSSNQELEVRNRELQRKADESAKAHDDLVNLVASSDVATIFLDRDMRILRYTPRFAEFFNVIPADLGRPLQDITNRLDYAPLADEAAQVFVTLQAMEREVRSKDGRDFIVRVHPYRTLEHRIEGAVMTFFDISSRRAAEDALRDSEARLSTMFESLPVGVGVMDPDGVVRLSNRIMHAFLPNGKMPSCDAERARRWRGWHPDGRQVEPHEFPGARAQRGEWVVPGIEMLYRRDDGSETWTQVAAAAVVDGEGRRTGEVAVVITDIDALKRTEEALRENEARLRDLLGGLALAVWETDAAGRVVTDSPSWRAYTGQSVEEWMGEGWLDAVHPDDRAGLMREWQDAVARRTAIDHVYRLRTPEGGWRRSRVRALPLFNIDGTVRKWVGMNVAGDQG